MFHAAVRLGVVAVCVLSLGGCGLANQHHSITWNAALDTLPDKTCVRDAVTSVPTVLNVQDASQGTKRLVLTVFLSTNDLYPQMYVVVAGPPDGFFRIDYSDYARMHDEREQAARAILDRVSAACGVPDLASRARESHEAEWSPYLFNI